MESTIDEEVQADIPEPLGEETELKIRPLERITRHPKVPVEPSAYGKGKNFSRPWILQDGRGIPGQGSEMREQYKIPKKPRQHEGIRKRMLTDFFWEQMLDEVIEELATSQPVVEYCSEYDANFIKDQFEPRNLEVTADKNGVKKAHREHAKSKYRTPRPPSVSAHITAKFERPWEVPGILRKNWNSFFKSSSLLLSTTMLRRTILQCKTPDIVDLTYNKTGQVRVGLANRGFRTLEVKMHLKYPLYGTGSSAITFYSENIKKTGPGEILEKFRRCQYFTKPMEERLDVGWVL